MMTDGCTDTDMDIITMEMKDIGRVDAGQTQNGIMLRIMLRIIERGRGRL